MCVWGGGGVSSSKQHKSNCFISSNLDTPLPPPEAHLIDGAVGDDDNSGGVDGDGEVGEELPDELDLVVEVVRAHRGARVHQEHQVSLQTLASIIN